MKQYEETQIKDVFAHFGRAYYQASVLEAGLIAALMQIEFVLRVRDQFLSGERKIFIRADYEKEFDSFMDNQHAQTLGNLIKRVSRLSEVSEGLKQRLQEAKKRRDFLSHHYFRERAVEFCDPLGRNKMISELDSEGRMFEELDGELHSELALVRHDLGMTGEAFDRFIQDFHLKHGIDTPER